MRPKGSVEKDPPPRPAKAVSEAPTVAPCKRNTLRGRVVRRTLCAKRVAASVGEITRGCEIFGVTKGDWSLVDLIEHCLNTTGPADVVVCTWTAGGNDATFASNLLTNGSIKSLRFVVDLSFPSRQPSYCAALRQRFGDDAIRLTRCHAKFVTIRNKRWNVVIRTSMNLNENRRLETWEVSDSKPMADWLQELVDQLFQEQTPADAFNKTAGELHADFDTQWGDVGSRGPDPTSQEFFGDGPLDVDLRRVGISRR